MVDHGTSYQQCCLLEDGRASTVWAALLRRWVRPFGLPEMILSDGGPEFGGHIARSCEHHG
eukprot:220111-Pyramimonas_sp.AAC.1